MAISVPVDRIPHQQPRLANTPDLKRGERLIYGKREYVSCRDGRTVQTLCPGMYKGVCNVRFSKCIEQCCILRDDGLSRSSRVHGRALEIMSHR